MSTFVFPLAVMSTLCQCPNTFMHKMGLNIVFCHPVCLWKLCTVRD